MEIFTHLFNFIVDKNRHTSTRVLMFICMLLTVLLINDITGFTYYYNIDKKIEQIKNINALANDSALSPAAKRKLLILEDEVINRKTIRESVYSLLSDASTNLNKPSLPVVKAVETRPKKGDVVVMNGSIVYPTPRNNFIHLLTSSGWYLLVIVVLIPAIAFSDKNLSYGDIVLIVIIVSSMLAGFSWLNYYLFGFIPKLGKTWAWNYVLNGLMHTAILYLLAFLATKYDKK